MPDRPLLSRRAVVGGALGAPAAALLAACDLGDDLTPPDASATLSPSPGEASATPTGPASGDEALVDQVTAQLNQALGVLVTARRFPALRQPLGSLVAAHRAHLGALEAPVGGWTAPTLAGAPGAVKAVRHSEEQLQAALVDAAGRAESGALARLLASASASVTQHLLALPAPA